MSKLQEATVNEILDLVHACGPARSKLNGASLKDAERYIYKDRGDWLLWLVWELEQPDFHTKKCTTYNLRDTAGVCKRCRILGLTIGEAKRRYPPAKLKRLVNRVLKPHGRVIR